MTDMQRIFAVRAFARAHDEGGWDILREIWSNRDIAKATRGASTPQECVARIAKTLRLIDDIRGFQRERNRAADLGGRRDCSWQPGEGGSTGGEL